MTACTDLETGEPALRRGSTVGDCYAPTPASLWQHDMQVMRITEGAACRVWEKRDDTE